MNPMEIMADAEKCTLPEFGLNFQSFKEEAFRLECLPIYRVNSETTAIQQFERGEPKPVPFNQDWIDILESAKSRGATISRIRLLPRPITSYVKFEYSWGYLPQQNLGEEVRAIDLHRIDVLASATLVIDHWIFDRSNAFLMVYDFMGQFMGVLKAGTATTQLLVKQASHFRTVSQPLSEFELYFSQQ